MIKTISILLGLIGFISLCVWSFDYVEGHESTELKQKIEECSVQIEHAGVMNQERVAVEGKLRQVCSLLRAADIGSIVCDGLEENEEDGAVESEAEVESETVETEAEDDSHEAD